MLLLRQTSTNYQ